jgi:hypothetical protein
VDSAGNLYVGDSYNNTIRKGIPNYGQPIVVEPPQSTTAYAGSNVTLTANIVGNAPLSYQWQFNGINLAGQTGAALNLTNAQTNASGNYSVVVSNSLGLATSQVAVLNVSYPYTFITIAGLAGHSGVVDGTGSVARFVAPQGVAVDSADNLYVVDNNPDVIREVTSAGVVTTVVGSPFSFGSTDGTGT